MKQVLTLMTLLAVAGIDAGCASNSYGHLFTPQTVQTNQVTQTATVFQTNEVIQTNIVTVTQTNGMTVVNTNTVQELVPVLVTNLVFRTNTVTVTNGWQVSGTVSNIVGYAQTANGATAFIDPYSVPISGILAGGLGLMSWWARLKTKQSQQHLSTATTLITAIEGLAPPVIAGVKAAVAAQALHTGTTNEVNATVQAVVGAMPAPGSVS